MIRDGVDRRQSAIHGWMPIDEVLFASSWALLDDRGEFWVRPKRILGLTRDGRSVYAYYRADGDYVDRWTDRTGTVVYELTHYRLPGKGGRPTT